MNTIGRFVSVFIVGASCIAPLAGAAEGRHDGSVAMICTALVVHECAPGEYCQPRVAESVGLPSLFKVDVKAMKVHNLDPGQNRESVIRERSNVNGRLVVYGGELGRGWTVTINEQTGRLTGAVAADGEGYVLFGHCAVP